MISVSFFGCCWKLLKVSTSGDTVVVSRHLPLPQADAQSKQQQEQAIEQLLQELDIDLLVLAR